MTKALKPSNGAFLITTHSCLILHILDKSLCRCGHTLFRFLSLCAMLIVDNRIKIFFFVKECLLLYQGNCNHILKTTDTYCLYTEEKNPRGRPLLGLFAPCFVTSSSLYISMYLSFFFFPPSFPSFLFKFFFEIGSHNVALTGLEFTEICLFFCY